MAEVCQKVRIHLLLGTSEAGPQIAEYTGRGALLSWIRVIAVRMAITQGGLVRETGEENILAALEAMPAPGPDPEFELLKRRYHREFSQAVRESFAAVSSEQRCPSGKRA
jgi:RNA polymerase sigma-70 factor